MGSVGVRDGCCGVDSVGVRDGCCGVGSVGVRDGCCGVDSLFSLSSWLPSWSWPM